MLDLLMKEDREKTARLRKAMENDGLDALIFRLAEDIVYVSGYWPYCGPSCVFFPLDGEPSIVTIRDEEPQAEKSWIKDLHLVDVESIDRLGDPVKDAFNIIRGLAEDKKLANKVVGYEGSMELLSTNYQRRELWSVGLPFSQGLRDAFPRAEIRDISSLMFDMRSIKTPNEVDVLKIVNKIADIGLEAFHNAIREEMREVDVQAIVEHELITKCVGYCGVERLVPLAFVMSGRNSADAYKNYNVSTENKLKRGDLVLVELNVNVEGYWSDTTRVYVLGTPSEKQKRLFDVVIEAQQAAIDRIQVGVPASEISEAAFDVIKKHGLTEYIRHRLGHGTGCGLHEPIPAIHRASKHVLRANMVHSVEPGLYDPEVGGVRIEDMILDTNDGAERLNKYCLRD
jgi:Xaa-Pro dipeptidase